MKNQYVGDIGDYTKLALLRVVENAGFSVGVNWYLTPDDKDGKDGRHIKYLDSPCDTPDEVLHDALRSIVKEKQSRTVKSLVESGLLKNACFYDEVLDFSFATDRCEKRSEWHKRALTSLQPASVVFLDPDTGFIPDSRSPYSKEGTKHATYEEAAEYYNANKTVIVYNHRDRSPEEKYVGRLNRVTKIIDVLPENLICLTASKYSERNYLFIMQPNHSELLKSILDEMLNTSWSGYLRYRSLFDRCEFVLA